VKANQVYLRRGSSTDIAKPDEIAQMGAEDSASLKAALAVEVAPYVAPSGNINCLILPLRLYNRGHATAEDVSVEILEQPVGAFSVGLGQCSQMPFNYGRTTLKLKDSLHPGQHAFLGSANLGQVGGAGHCSFSVAKYRIKLLGKDLAPTDVSICFTANEMLRGISKTDPNL
jgi:hypothetical protein